MEVDTTANCVQGAAENGSPNIASMSFLWLKDVPSMGDLQEQAKDWESVLLSALGQTKYTETDMRQFFVSKLLANGPTCMETLYSVLAMHGFPGSHSHAQLAMDTAGDLLQSASEFLCTKNVGMPRAYAYWILCSSYCVEWERRYGALGLMDVPGFGVSVVRTGQPLTTLRQASLIEKLLWSPNDGEWSEDTAEFAQCVDLVLGSLGGVVLEAVPALLAVGANLEDDILPTMVNYLLRGPKSKDFPTGTTGAESGRRRANFRVLMGEVQWGELQSHLSSITNLQTVLGDICSAASTASANFGPAEREESDSPEGADLVVNCIRTNAQSHTVMLFGTLLLMALLNRVPSLYPARQQLDSASKEMWPRLAWLFKVYAMAQYLCSTPRAGDWKMAGSDGEKVPESPGGVTTAHRVITELCAFLVECEDRVSRSEGTDNALLRLSILLFELRDWCAVAFIGSLAAGMSDSQAFLKGLAVATRLKGVQGTPEYSGQVQAAVQLLFAGATGFVGEGESILREFWKKVCSGGQHEGHNDLHLMYLEAAMLVMEMTGAPEGAIQFADAAVRHVETSTTWDCDMEQRVSEAGGLRTRALRYACEAGDFDTAYAALLSLDQPHQALAYVEQLVKRACMAGQVDALLKLPFSGLLRVAKQGAITVVSLFQAALDVLEEWGAKAPLDNVPQPYMVWHALAISHNKFREAAEAMVKYARRVQADAPAVEPQGILRMENALACAVAALELVPERDAWIVDPANGDTGVASLADLTREYAVVSACVALSQSGRAPTGTRWTSLRGSDVFAELLAARDYAGALALSSRLHEGYDLTKHAERVFTTWVADCLQRQLDGETDLECCEDCWSDLRRCLESTEAEKHGQQLRFCVADAIQREGKRVQLPEWLLRLCQ
eukprot:evm.model.scf_2012.1 EVM.evm.TU.scf_2012.1   scf_2012:13793-25115(-)